MLRHISKKASKVHNHFFIHTLKKMIVRKFTKYTPLKNYMPSNKMYDQCYKSTIKSSSQQNQNSYVPHFLFFIAKKIFCAITITSPLIYCEMIF